MPENKKRRPKGSGSFKVLANGTIEYTVNVGKKPDGSRWRKKFYGDTQAACIRSYKDFMKQIGERKKAVSDYTLGQWLDRWLQSYRGKRIPAGERQIEQSTLDEYKKISNRIKKYPISNKRLVEIKPLQITDFFFEDLKDYGYTTLKKTRFLLNAAFEAAIDNEYCYRNPVRGASIPQVAPQQKTPFTRQELMAIYRFALTDKDFGHCIIIMLATGMRPQEFRALKAENIDLQKRKLSIVGAIKESGKEGVTKTRKPRVIPLTKSVARVLKDRMPSKGYVLGGDSYVGKDTLRSSYEAFFNRLNKQRKEKGKGPIRALSPQHCRHTCSTEMQRKGVKSQIVAAYLGHSNLKTTEGYTHLGDYDILLEAIDSL